MLTIECEIRDTEYEMIFFNYLSFYLIFKLKSLKFDGCVISNLVDQKTPGLRFYIKNEKNV